MGCRASKPARQRRKSVHVPECENDDTFFTADEVSEATSCPNGWDDEKYLACGSQNQEMSTCNKPVTQDARRARSLYKRVDIGNLPPNEAASARMLIENANSNGICDFGKELFRGSPGEGVRVVLHGLPDKDTGLNEYRGVVDIDGVPPEVFAAMYFQVEEQVEAHPDMYAVFQHIENTKGVADEVIRCVAKAPWPIDNREYLMTRVIVSLDDDGTVFASSKDTAALDDRFPRGGSSTARVAKMHSQCIIQRRPDGGTRFASIYFDDPGGSIPAWIINHIATSVTPKTFFSLRNACVQAVSQGLMPFGGDEDDAELDIGQGVMPFGGDEDDYCGQSSGL